MKRSIHSLTWRYVLSLLLLVLCAGNSGLAAAQTPLTEIQTSLFSNVKLLPEMEPMENAKAARPSTPVAKSPSMSIPCYNLPTIDLTAGCWAELPQSSALWAKTFDPLVGTSLLSATVPHERF